MQKVIMVSQIDEEKHNGLNEVNQMLKEGWKVISTSPMGAYGYGYGGGIMSMDDLNIDSIQSFGTGFASLVILEK